MPTLLLNLSGPLQSWGVNDRFVTRSTLKFPTKSGIIGLLAAAQGRVRTDPIADLAELRVGTRTEQVGTVLKDFQTEIDWVQHAKNGEGSKPLTYRYYLQDYRFLAGVEGPEGVLDELAQAVRAPKFPLFLGRRSCPPSTRVFHSLNPQGLEDALHSAPWMAAQWYQRQQPPQVQLQISRDAHPGEVPNEVLADLPLSFDIRHRRHTFRPVMHEVTEVANPESHNSSAAHDPFALLGGR